MWARAGISIHQGKTQSWNRAGVEHPECEILERMARVVDQAAHLWRGPGLQGLNIHTVGTRLRAGLFGSAVQRHHTLLERILLVPDVQSPWLFLLHCASGRANCMLRAAEPGSARPFHEAHDGNEVSR